jgi:hypothetical protein
MSLKYPDRKISRVGDTGFEPTPTLPANWQISPKGGAESSAVSTKTTHGDPDLAFVIKFWERLPNTTRQIILEVIQTYSKTPQSG